MLTENIALTGPEGVYLEEIIRILREAKRISANGATEDNPEGSIYIMISDTLAKNMADWLESYDLGQYTE